MSMHTADPVHRALADECIGRGKVAAAAVASSELPEIEVPLFHANIPSRNVSAEVPWIMISLIEAAKV